MKILRSRHETELEQLFAGKAPAGGGLDDVAGLVDGVKTAYLSGPDPELEATHLTGLMRVVHLTDKGDLAARPASKADGPGLQASGLPTRRRKFVFETLFASLAAKIATGGIAVAMASTGAAAATGNLPDRVQTTVSQAAEKIGLEIPLGETAASQQEALDVDEVPDVDADVDPDGSEDVGEPNENAGFGQDVSEDAQDGGVDGGQVSGDAREMGEERKEAGQSNRPEDTPEGGPGQGGGQQPPAGGQVGDTPGAGYAPGEAPPAAPGTDGQDAPAGGPVDAPAGGSVDAPAGGPLDAPAGASGGRP